MFKDKTQQAPEIFSQNPHYRTKMSTMFAIIDIETTGLRTGDNKITEIGILIHNGKKVIDSFSTLINPQRSIPSMISSLTGITDEMVEDAPKFYEVAKKIVEITDGMIFVAHNARFDYGFIKKEFSELGYSYQRKNLCTVRLAKEYFPGLRSYSLSKLCHHFKITQKAHHRAMDDAISCSKIFEMVYKKSGGKLESSAALKCLPPNLQKRSLDNLPDECGVYYLKDVDGKILYIGKSLNIKSRVLTHLATEYKSPKKMIFKNSVAKIDCILTGSELIALLLEYREIKSHRPPFNRAAKGLKFPYSVYISNGELKVGNEQAVASPIKNFATKSRAENFIERMISTYMLDQKMSEDMKNQILDKINDQFSYPSENFVATSTGRHHFERGYILIRNGIFEGFGHFDIRDLEHPEQLCHSSVEFPCIEDRDFKQLILTHLKKNPTIFKFSSVPTHQHGTSYSEGHGQHFSE
ncbi:MAG: GIY-YIG nuclease family protein [Bacteriovoracaceae bacterium]|nr:GIY-YIG nuclease family protein [Bacteriovoracaceae bacterium]